MACAYRYRREGLWLLLVDLKQAFDSVHRGLLFTEMELQAALPACHRAWLRRR